MTIDRVLVIVPDDVATISALKPTMSHPIA